MAHKRMIATRSMRYGTRMLSAGDDVVMSGPSSRLFEAMGYVVKQAKWPQLSHGRPGEEGGSKRRAGDDIAALRAAYEKKLGKRPFNGWDAATLRDKIAAA